MGFSRQEYWSGLPCFPAGDLPNNGIEFWSALQADSLLSESPGKSHITLYLFNLYPLYFIIRYKKSFLPDNHYFFMSDFRHPITSWEIDGETVETVSDFIFWGSKSMQIVTAAMKLKDTPWK